CPSRRSAPMEISLSTRTVYAPSPGGTRWFCSTARSTTARTTGVAYVAVSRGGVAPWIRRVASVSSTLDLLCASLRWRQWPQDARDGAASQDESDQSKQPKVQVRPDDRFERRGHE